MSLGKVARKLKRVGKSAVQFRFVSTFEYVELSLNGSWRPDTLRVVWLRNHRKVKSTDVKWVPTEDRGPNGANGRAVFDPIISVALLVTLYRESGQMDFQEKEYKYYIENFGPNGKKILASFHCDMAEYAGVPSAEHALAMSFKPVSVKVDKAILGITLSSEFIKQGSAVDDDMQSTFSAMSAGTDADYREEEEDDFDEGPVPRKLTMVDEGVEEGEGSGAALTESLKSVLVLGTGQTLKRNTLPASAPPKPNRSLNPASKGAVIDQSASETEPPPSAESGQASNNTADTSDAKGQPEGQTSGGPTALEEAVKRSEDGLVNGHETSVTGDASSQKGGSKEREPTPPASSQKGGSKERKPTPAQDPAEQTDKSKVKGEVLSSLGDETKDPDKKLANGYTETKPADTGIKQNGLPTESHVQANYRESHSESSHKQEDRSHDKTQNNDNKAQNQDKPQSNHKEGDRSHDKAQSNRKEDDKSHDKAQSNHKEDDRSHDKPQNKSQNGSTSEETLIESVEPKHKPESREMSYGGGGYDYVFEAARSLAQLRKSSEANKTADQVPSARKEVQSNDEYRPPPNPFLVEEEIEESVELSPTCFWLEEAMFVDCFGETVGRDKLDRADIIALYFSASWCPPCRKFLPKLVKFYHHLKQNGKSFEVLYISSDYSKQDMMKYMQQQQMPWVGLAFEGNAAQNLQKKLSVQAVPQLKIVSTKGTMIEEVAKKPVEATHSGADVLRLYNKWHDKLDPSERVHAKRTVSIMKKPKRGIPQSSTETECSSAGSALATQTTSKEREDSSSPRQVIDHHHHHKSRSSSHRGKSREVIMEEKDDKIHHLEEINITLKQTNDDLTEEVAELKRQVAELTAKMSEMEKNSKQLEEDKKETIAKLSTRGWLYKKGIKGPTASIWRRRYFRCDQGSKICYYKSATEGTPQGFIDLAKLISVQEVSPAQQDKNNATFLVQCDGRTYQLQAYDESTMRKWMSAMEYLSRWHKENTLRNGARP